MKDSESLPKLTIEEEQSFRSSLRYIFNHYDKVALYGKFVIAKKLVAAADHHQKAIIKYAVLEDPEEKSIQGIPVRNMNSRADGIDLVVVCTDKNEYEYVERAKKWVGGSVLVDRIEQMIKEEPGVEWI